jgi:hypothetical protein
VRRILQTLAVLALLTLPALGEPRFVYLVTLPRKGFENIVWDQGRATLNGETVLGTLQGLGGAEDAAIKYELDGRYDLLEVLAGYLDSAPDGRSCIFEVWADGELLQQTEPIRSDQKPVLLRVPLKGKKILVLRMHPTAYDNTHGAAWGSARLWTGIQGEIPGSLSVTIDGRTTRVNPAYQDGLPTVQVPLAIRPGKHSYTVQVDYDEKTGEVKVVTGSP